MKKYTKISTVTMAALTASLLGGCAATMQAEKSINKATKDSETIYSGAAIKTTSAIQDSTRESKGNFAKVKKNWVDPNPLPKYETAMTQPKLPAVFSDKVSLTMPGKVSLIEILSELQRAKKIKFSINQDIYNSVSATGSIITPNNAGATQATPASTTNVPQSALGTNNTVPVFINDFVYSGTLEDSLDLLASKANISWKWNGKSIEVYRFETKNYSLSALAGKTTSNATVTIAGGGTAGTGGAGATAANNNSQVSRSSDLATWEDVKSYLMTLTSKDGKIAILESSGIITVKDTPSNQVVIEKAIKELNASLGKQIYMDVKIYSVVLNNADNFGLNWNVAFAQAAGKYGISLAGGSAVASGVSIGTTVNTGQYAGSTAALSALSSIGKTTIVNEYTVSTLNGQTTPIGNNTKQDYIKKIENNVTATTAGSVTTTTATADSVYEGVTMSITPQIQKDMDKILLEYSLTINSIDDIEKAYTDINGNKTTLPITSIKNVLQRSALRSGQTLVLSGFKQAISKITRNGVGSPENQALGGARNASNASQYLVITVTPYVAQD